MNVFLKKQNDFLTNRQKKLTDLEYELYSKTTSEYTGMPKINSKSRQIVKNLSTEMLKPLEALYKPNEYDSCERSSFLSSKTPRKNLNG